MTGKFSDNEEVDAVLVKMLETARSAKPNQTAAQWGISVSFHELDVTRNWIDFDLMIKEKLADFRAGVQRQKVALFRAAKELPKPGGDE